MHYDLGYIDLEQKTSQPLDNPSGARLLRMSWVRTPSSMSPVRTPQYGAKGESFTCY